MGKLLQPDDPQQRRSLNLGLQRCLGVKSTLCSCRPPTLGSWKPHQEAHDCLKLQSQGIRRLPSLCELGTGSTALNSVLAPRSWVRYFHEQSPISCSLLLDFQSLRLRKLLYVTKKKDFNIKCFRCELQNLSEGRFQA